jgi:hypothetical protein
MGLPAMSARGFPGNLVDAIRAGITTIGFTFFSVPPATYATLRRNESQGSAGNVPPILEGSAGIRVRHFPIRKSIPASGV